MIATGSRDHGAQDGPAGAVWAVYGTARANAKPNSVGWRVRLAELRERGPREHWPSRVDMPLTEAALAKPTSQELRFGMTADEMQARGLDPQTGEPTGRRSHHRPRDDYDDFDLAYDIGPPADIRRSARADAEGPIVRGAVRRSSGGAEPSGRTGQDYDDGELIDIDTGQPIQPSVWPDHQPHGPQGQRRPERYHR